MSKRTVETASFGFLALVRDSKMGTLSRPTDSFLVSCGQSGFGLTLHSIVSSCCQKVICENFCSHDWPHANQNKERVRGSVTGQAHQRVILSLKIKTFFHTRAQMSNSMKALI